MYITFYFTVVTSRSTDQQVDRGAEQAAPSGGPRQTHQGPLRRIQGNVPSSVTQTTRLHSSL